MIKTGGNLGKIVRFFCKLQKLCKNIQLDDECSNYIFNQLVQIDYTEYKGVLQIFWLN